MTAVIITGGIDLSVGSIMGARRRRLRPASCRPSYPWCAGRRSPGSAPALLAGAVNGVLIAYVGLPPFVVTLGMLSIARSLAIVLSQNKMIYEFGPDGDIFKAIGGGRRSSGIANPVWC